MRGQSITYMGVSIVPSKLIPGATPVRQLPKDLDVSPEFRKEFDAWLLDFFGEHYQCFVSNPKTIVVNPKVYRSIAAGWPDEKMVKLIRG